MSKHKWRQIPICDELARTCICIYACQDTSHSKVLWIQWNFIMPGMLYALYGLCDATQLQFLFIISQFSIGILNPSMIEASDTSELSNLMLGSVCTCMAVRQWGHSGCSLCHHLDGWSQVTSTLRALSPSNIYIYIIMYLCSRMQTDTWPTVPHQKRKAVLTSTYIVWPSMPNPGGCLRRSQIMSWLMSNESIYP